MISVIFVMIRRRQHVNFVSHFCVCLFFSLRVEGEGGDKKGKAQTRHWTRPKSVGHQGVWITQTFISFFFFFPYFYWLRSQPLLENEKPQTRNSNNTTQCFLSLFFSKNENILRLLLVWSSLVFDTCTSRFGNSFSFGLFSFLFFQKPTGNNSGMKKKKKRGKNMYSSIISPFFNSFNKKYRACLVRPKKDVIMTAALK